MKRIAVLALVLSILAAPMVAQAQATTTTAFQVVNLSGEDANINITFYNQDGTTAYTMADTITANSSKTYIQASMTGVPDGFNGSVVISSDQPIAAIVNQNTSGDYRFNGSYTGFSAGSDTFYAPVVLNMYYGWYTEISVQNASASAVDVTVTYDTAGCTDTQASLAPGAVVRFDNRDTCSGGLNQNGSGTITATGGTVVAVINQMNETGEKEQTYSGFSTADGGATLYSPIALKAYYTFNSSFQVQNISGAAMDITATYDDGETVTVTGVADGASATFLQANEAHADGWTGSAEITNSTSGAMVAIVNQASAGGKASSFNMFAGGSTNWALPSLLKAYYGYNSAFQVKNISGGSVDVSVTYDDAVTASATGLADGASTNFLQAQEAHADGWAGSGAITATGDIVVVVNQDAPGDFDKQYSYNGVPLQ